ncbi:CbrC family protein [Hyphomonas sp.]|uniref:CbrC family protein n=1 Tax=Hyphomonas sp. TaxID=87 RepID=UPI00391929A2
MSGDKPFFRFNPRAYELGSFEPSDLPCQVCGRACVWKYTGSVYCIEEIDPVCARCISDGRLGEAVQDGDYSLHDVDLDDADPELADEVLKRTPDFSTFNPFEWPVVDGEPLAFVGYGDDMILWNDPAVKEAIIRMSEGAGFGTPDAPMGYALVFRRLNGGDYIATLDLD